MSRQKWKEPERERDGERGRDAYLYMVDAAFFFGDFITKQTWRRPKTPKLNDRHLWQVPKKKRHYDVYYATDSCLLISSWRICLLHAADYSDAAKASPKKIKLVNKNE